MGAAPNESRKLTISTLPTLAAAAKAVLPWIHFESIGMSWSSSFPMQLKSTFSAAWYSEDSWDGGLCFRRRDSLVLSHKSTAFFPSAFGILLQAPLLSSIFTASLSPLSTVMWSAVFPSGSWTLMYTPISNKSDRIDSRLFSSSQGARATSKNTLLPWMVWSRQVA